MRSQMDWALADAGAMKVASATAAKVRTVKRLLSISLLSLNLGATAAGATAGASCSVRLRLSNRLPHPPGETVARGNHSGHGSASPVPLRKYEGRDAEECLKTVLLRQTDGADAAHRPMHEHEDGRPKTCRDRKSTRLNASHTDI